MATADEHLEIASFARDGTLIGSGVYGLTGKHPAPAVASGPSGEVVLAGGLTQLDMNLGTKTLPNNFAWSMDGFFAKNPPYAALGADPAAPPPAPPPPETVRSADVYALATSANALFWVERPDRRRPIFSVHVPRRRLRSRRPAGPWCIPRLPTRLQGDGIRRVRRRIDGRSTVALEVSIWGLHRGAVAVRAPRFRRGRELLRIPLVGPDRQARRQRVRSGWVCGALRSSNMTRSRRSPTSP